MRKLIDGLANATALVGGLALGAVILMTCASIAGRALSFAGLGPVRGDYELTEIGVAFAVFCFLPLAQLRGAHAAVDLFVTGLPAAAQRFLIAFSEVVLTIVAIVILWRLWAGMEDKMRYGESTFLLRLPIWYAYAACLVPAGVAVLIGVFSAADRILAAATGRPIEMITQGGDDA